MNFGSRLVGFKFQFRLVSKVYVIDPYDLETRKPTWTFLHVTAEVSAPEAYGDMPGS